MFMFMNSQEVLISENIVDYPHCHAEHHHTLHNAAQTRDQLHLLTMRPGGGRGHMGEVPGHSLHHAGHGHQSEHRH